MVDMPAHPSSFDPVTLAQLACPACHGNVCFENSRLLCIACGRTYPILNGIPVMIVDRAERPGEVR